MNCIQVAVRIPVVCSLLLLVQLHVATGQLPPTLPETPEPTEVPDTLTPEPTPLPPAPTPEPTFDLHSEAFLDVHFVVYSEARSFLYLQHLVTGLKALTDITISTSRLRHVGYKDATGLEYGEVYVCPLRILPPSDPADTAPAGLVARELLDVVAAAQTQLSVLGLVAIREATMTSALPVTPEPRTEEIPVDGIDVVWIAFFGGGLLMIFASAMMLIRKRRAEGFGLDAEARRHEEEIGADGGESGVLDAPLMSAEDQEQAWGADNAETVALHRMLQEAALVDAVPRPPPRRLVPMDFALQHEESLVLPASPAKYDDL